MSTKMGHPIKIGILAVLAASLLLVGCQKPWALDPQDLAANSAYPPLKFNLVEAETGKAVTAADFRGKIVMLYFGYTHCPNVCPLTLSDVARMFQIIGKPAQHIRFLFVTVDPRRDTLPLLKKYIALYGSEDILGLRGTETDLHAAATRYHAAYTVHPSADPAKYTVTHSAAVVVFNRDGKAEFIITGLATRNPHIRGIAKDLAHLVQRNSI